MVWSTKVCPTINKWYAFLQLIHSLADSFEVCVLGHPLQSGPVNPPNKFCSRAEVLHDSQFFDEQQHGKPAIQSASPNLSLAHRVMHSTSENSSERIKIQNGGVVDPSISCDFAELKCCDAGVGRMPWLMPFCWVLVCVPKNTHPAIHRVRSSFSQLLEMLLCVPLFRNVCKMSGGKIGTLYSVSH